MNVTTDHASGIAIVRVGESRLMYPLLSEFSSVVTQLLASGEKKVIVDLSSVGYVDSATIGCLMDLYRQTSAAGGSLKLAGVQKRVETMLTMTGAQNFIEVHPDEHSAVKSFGAETDGHDPIDDRRRGAARRRPDDRHRKSLPGDHREARARADLRGYGEGDPGNHRPDDRR